MTDTPETLSQLLCRLRGRPPAAEPPGDEPWATLIDRITVPGVTHAVTEDVYDYFLDVLPPRWMDRGVFAFGEGADLLRLFWVLPGRVGFCARQLTADEHILFCRLARIGLTSG